MCERPEFVRINCKLRSNITSESRFIVYTSILTAVANTCTRERLSYMPIHVRSSATSSTFRRHLKSHLFQSSFPTAYIYIYIATHLSASDSLRPWRYINLLTYLLTHLLANVSSICLSMFLDCIYPTVANCHQLIVPRHKCGKFSLSNSLRRGSDPFDTRYQSFFGTQLSTDSFRSALKTYLFAAQRDT